MRLTREGLLVARRVEEVRRKSESVEPSNLTEFFRAQYPLVVNGISGVRARREVRRRLLEEAFGELTRRKAGDELVRNAYGNLSRLGFSDLQRRATFNVLFAYHLRDCADDAGACTLILGLIRRLQKAALAGESSSLVKYYLWLLPDRFAYPALQDGLRKLREVANTSGSPRRKRESR